MRTPPIGQLGGARCGRPPPIEAERPGCGRPREAAAEPPVSDVADLLGLEPDVAGQGLVGPLAGEGDLVPLLRARRWASRIRQAHEVSSTGPSAARISSG